MVPSSPKLSSKNRYPSSIIILGLVCGLLLTALLWWQRPNQLSMPLTWFSIGLIGLGSFLYLRQTSSSHRRWLTILAMIAAISLLYLFPEMFGPACGGIPRAFASPSYRCGRCVDFVCEWNAKKHKEHCYCNEWDDTGCTGAQSPEIEADLTCDLWGLNGWCASSYSLDLSAVEPQGLDVMISGDVDGTAFACTASAGTSTCSVPLPEGNGTASFTATSVSGLTASGSSSYQRDSVQPQIDGWLNGTAGSNDWFLSTVDVNASASDPIPGSGLAAFDLNLDDGGWESYTGLLSLSDGVHSLGFRASDVAGNTTETAQTIKVDTVTPALDLSVTGTAGANGWYRSDVQVSAVASDSGSGLDTFEYNLDSSGWVIYSAPLDLNDGTHNLSVRAVDIAGNTTTWTQSFQVDTLTPLLNLTVDGTQGASGWYTSGVQVSLVASDPDSPPSTASGLSALEYNLDSTGWASYSAPLELSDGIHSLELRASDLAGNVTNGTQSFQVDTTPPALDVNVNGTQGTSPWYISIVQVEAVASDVTSALSKLEVKTDGGDWSAYNAALAFGDGSHSYRFRAWDNAGNLTETALQSLQVDTIPPAISLPESWELGKTVDFDLQDNGSGLARVRLVIEDEDERYPKVTWDDALGSYTFEGVIDWNGRFKDGTLAPYGGEYYATLKVSDNAGNESHGSGQIEVPLVSFVDPPNDSSVDLVSGTAGTDPIATQVAISDPEEAAIAQLPNENGSSTFSFGGGGNEGGASRNPSALSLGGGNNGLASSSNAEIGTMSFNSGGQSNSPVSSDPSNVLWGATATAAIGAFAAEIARRKQEEEAKAAELAAMAEKRAERRADSDYRKKVQNKKKAQLEAKWEYEQAQAVAEATI